MRHLGIELPPGPALDLAAGGTQRLRRAVGTVGSDGVESIGNCADPCPEGNLLSLEAPRIAAAVVALLMGVDISTIQALTLVKT